MATVNYVTKLQMKKETGMPVLGYSDPKNNRILLQKGMDKETEHEVRAHEFDHMSNGEEGPFWPQVIAAGASVISGYLGSQATDRATAEQRHAREEFRTETEPYRTGLSNLLIGGDTSGFEASPFYRQGMEEGEEGTRNYLARTGMRLSGRGMKEMERFRGRTQQKNIGNYISAMQAGAGGPALSANVGQTAAGNIGQLGIQGAGAINQAFQGGASNWIAQQQNERMMNLLNQSNVQPQFTPSMYGDR